MEGRQLPRTKLVPPPVKHRKWASQSSENQNDDSPIMEIPPTSLQSTFPKENRLPDISTPQGKHDGEKRGQPHVALVTPPTTTRSHERYRTPERGKLEWDSEYFSDSDSSVKERLTPQVETLNDLLASTGKRLGNLAETKFSPAKEDDNLDEEERDLDHFRRQLQQELAKVDSWVFEDAASQGNQRRGNQPGSVSHPDSILHFNNIHFSTDSQENTTTKVAKVSPSTNVATVSPMSSPNYVPTISTELIDAGHHLTQSGESTRIDKDNGKIVENVNNSERTNGEALRILSDTPTSTSTDTSQQESTSPTFAHLPRHRIVCHHKVQTTDTADAVPDSNTPGEPETVSDLYPEEKRNSSSCSHQWYDSMDARDATTAKSLLAAHSRNLAVPPAHSTSNDADASAALPTNDANNLCNPTSGFLSFNAACSSSPTLAEAEGWTQSQIGFHAFDESTGTIGNATETNASGEPDASAELERVTSGLHSEETTERGTCQLIPPEDVITDSHNPTNIGSTEDATDSISVSLYEHASPNLLWEKGDPGISASNPRAGASDNDVDAIAIDSVSTNSSPRFPDRIEDRWKSQITSNIDAHNPTRVGLSVDHTNSNSLLAGQTPRPVSHENTSPNMLLEQGDHASTSDAIAEASGHDVDASPIDSLSTNPSPHSSSPIEAQTVEGGTSQSIGTVVSFPRTNVSGELDVFLLNQCPQGAVDRSHMTPSNGLWPDQTAFPLNARPSSSGCTQSIGTAHGPSSTFSHLQDSTPYAKETCLYNAITSNHTRVSRENERSTLCCALSFTSSDYMETVCQERPCGTEVVENDSHPDSHPVVVYSAHDVDEKTANASANTQKDLNLDSIVVCRRNPGKASDDVYFRAVDESEKPGNVNSLRSNLSHNKRRVRGSKREWQTLLAISLCSVMTGWVARSGVLGGVQNESSVSILRVGQGGDRLTIPTIPTNTTAPTEIPTPRSGEVPTFMVRWLCSSPFVWSGYLDHVDVHSTIHGRVRLRNLCGWPNSSS